MPVYVYVCKTPTCKLVGTRQEVKKRMDEYNVATKCPECKEVMGRVPAPFRFGFSPWDVLSEHIDERFRDYKRRQAAGNPRRPVVK